MSNVRSGVVSEIILIKLIVGAKVPDVYGRGVGHQFGFRDAALDEGFAFRFSTADREFALIDVGDRDGDGPGTNNVDRGGMGGGLNAVVDPDHLEPRDRVEGESSWAAGREIVQGRHYQVIPLNRGHERSFWIQNLPSCSAVAFLPAGMTTQSFSERSSVGVGYYGNQRDY